MPFSSIEEMQSAFLKKKNKITDKVKKSLLQDIANKQPKLPIQFEVTNKLEDPKDLYFIRQKGTNMYKIGRSKNPEERLQYFEPYTPFELELFLVIKNGGFLENEFHIFFSSFNVKNEWFEITIENILQCVVQTITSKYENLINTKFVNELERKIHFLEYQILQYRSLILDEEDEDSFLFY